MSYYTSLTGLSAAQINLETISNNLANVGTVGFKQSRADFGDIMANTAYDVSNRPGLGTHLQGMQQMFTQGSFQSTGRTLDLAISGNGFFVTNSQIGGDGQSSYTRDGEFGMNSDGYVIDQTGAFLQVLPVDGSGNPTSASLQNLRVPETTGSAQATGSIDFGVTLPSDADLPASRSMYDADHPYAFSASDPNSYNYSTSTTVYDSSGNPVQAQVYYVRTSAPSDSDPNSSWQAHVVIGGQEVSTDGDANANPPVPATLTFDGDGVMTSPTTALTLAPVTPPGSTSPISISMDFTDATKQAASSFSLTSVTQDGHAAGELAGLSIDTSGVVTATYSDGTITKLGRVAVASFANNEGLCQMGDGHWSASGTSGLAKIAGANMSGMGAIQSGALEQSNVDITTELVALIQAQQNYQANAKAIDTATQMLEAAVNLRS